MGKIKVSSCETDGMVIEGLHVIEPTVFNDERGYFMAVSYTHLTAIYIEECAANRFT